MPSYRTIDRTHRHEIDKIKGSRFIADVFPCRSDEEARLALQSVRETFPGATHHCHARRTGLDRDATRVSDDGEPAGTAGQPILRRIDGARLSDVLVVVTRYFGGTKLGTGGLVRAYGQAAAAVLERASIIEVPLCQGVEVTLPYSLQGVVDGLLNSYGLCPVARDFAEDIHLELQVPVEQLDLFLSDLGERTAGRVRTKRTRTG